MRSLYPDMYVLLTQGIVLSITMDCYGVKISKREEILMCLHQDPEKAINGKDEENIKKLVKNVGYTYRKIDMYTDKIIIKKKSIKDLLNNAH